jgi:methylenetetrahydrofolate dehydrogenase (NADP+)/methenyltetrahydrofolate cyclohydrolase
LLVGGRPRFVPCTPAGVMKMLEYEGIDLEGKRAVVVGRSDIVGKPMALLLLQKGATVTICHSKTPNLGEVTREADVLVVAAGKPNLVNASAVKPGAVVVDVGINRLPDGRLAGDVDFRSLVGVASHLTPVPGGVGPMTIAMLLANTVLAAERSTGD